MPIYNINSLRMHVQQQGCGRDVILIHGVTGDLSIWLLSRVMQTLAESRKVTTYDLRGHGYSDAPASGYTSADHASDLLALMDHLEIEKASLVGHSFGGVIAAHVASLAPHRVESLVLSDPYFPAMRHLEDVSRWGHWQNFRAEAENAGVLLSDEYWYDIGKFFDQILHLDEARLLKLRQAVGLPGLKRLLRLGKTTCGDDSKVDAGLSTEKILAIEQPVLALYGERSPFLSTADFLAANLPNCQRVLIPNAMHRAPEENAKAFLSSLLTFLVPEHEALSIKEVLS